MEKQITVEELLKPRYKVINLYPNCDFFIGQIIDFTDSEFEKEIGVLEWINGQCFSMEDFNKFPHLFKKLEWWEERKPEEMPRFVRHTINDKSTFYKITGWNIGEFTTGYIDGIRQITCNKDVSPATESDYNLQTSNNKQLL